MGSGEAADKDEDKRAEDGTNSNRELSDQKERIIEECILFTDSMKSRKVTLIVSGLSDRRSLDW